MPRMRAFWVANAMLFLEEAVYLAVVPLLPYYTSRFDLSKTEAGLLYSSYPLLILVSSLGVGVVAERADPRRLLAFGCALLVAATLVFGYATAAWQLWLARAVQGFTGGVIATAGMALIAGSAQRRRATTIGLALSLQGLSTLVGPVLGGYVADAAGVGTAFSIAAGMGLAILGTTWLVPAAPPAERRSLSEAGLRAAFASPAARAAMLAAALIGLVSSATQALTPLRLDRGGYSASAIATVLAVAGFVGLASTPIAGWVADRAGTRRAIAAWSVAMPLLVFGLALPLPVWATAAFLAAILPLTRAGATIAYARGADHAPLGAGLAMSYALLVTGWAAGATVGPVAAGAIADVANDNLATAAIGLAALILALPAIGRPRRLAAAGHLGRRGT